MIIKYWKFQSNASLTDEEAKTFHHNKKAYVASIYSEHILLCQITVYANESLIIRYLDKIKRWRWACHWTDKAELGNNQLSNIHCFAYNEDNSGREENYKSSFAHYNNGDKRKDYIHYFDLGTERGLFNDFSERRTYSLPFPEFGKYEDYLNFPYQEKFPELEEWPLSIFPEGEKPQKNIPIHKIIL